MASLDELFTAIESGKLDNVNAILATPGGPALLNAQDIDGHTPLNKAAIEGDKNIFLAILNKTLDKAKSLKLADKDGDTPLSNASIQNNKEVVEAILAISEGTATLGLINETGFTPLNSAASNGNKESIDAILKKDAGKATLNTANKLGITPLSSALYFEETETADVLSKTDGIKVTDTDISAAKAFVLAYPRREAEDAGKDDKFLAALEAKKAEIELSRAPAPVSGPSPMPVGVTLTPSGVPTTLTGAPTPGVVPTPAPAPTDGVVTPATGFAPAAEVAANPAVADAFKAMHTKAKDGTIVAGRHVKGVDANHTGLIQDILKVDVGVNKAGRGHFGPKTEAAVKQFQKQVGLKDDGKVSRLTLVALEAFDLEDTETKGFEKAKEALGKEVQALITDKQYSPKTAKKAIATPPQELEAAAKDWDKAHLHKKQHHHH